jgi:hypothetical protein
VGRDGKSSRDDLGGAGSGIFLQTGLDCPNQIEKSQQIALWAHGHVARLSLRSARSPNAFAKTEGGRGSLPQARGLAEGVTHLFILSSTNGGLRCALWAGASAIHSLKSTPTLLRCGCCSFPEAHSHWTFRFFTTDVLESQQINFCRA